MHFSFKISLTSFVRILDNCSAVAKAKLSSENFTLRVSWSTDVAYGATVTHIPDHIKQRLKKRDYSM